MTQIMRGFPTVGVDKDIPFRQPYGVTFESTDSDGKQPLVHTLFVLAMNSEDASMVAERWLNDQWPGRKVAAITHVDSLPFVWKE